jgi:hypothetical protein
MKHEAMLPPDLVQYLSQHMPVEDVLGAELVTTDAPKLPTTRMVVDVSYVPRLRSFSAHKEGLGKVRTSSMPDLLAKLAELWPDVEFSLVLSKVARAEFAARRKGVPRAEGWT